MTWFTIDSDGTRIPHATWAAATRHALRASHNGEVAVIPSDDETACRGCGGQPPCWVCQEDE